MVLCNNISIHLSVFGIACSVDERLLPAAGTDSMLLPVALVRRILRIFPGNSKRRIVHSSAPKRPHTTIRAMAARASWNAPASPASRPSGPRPNRIQQAQQRQTDEDTAV
ncbi:unnamed protein product [Nesidiocoris tenuis]|uniref:Uncharacterized protein n=1 Tax=Nesidiocoris tenuis TaxID=355587 RepID=A0A6H5GBH8_9HEMI|nr:unnamed protein product [Nesidiocoris tenuis]